MRSFLKYLRDHILSKTRSKCLSLVNSWFRDWRIRNWTQWELIWRIRSFSTIQISISTGMFWTRIIQLIGWNSVRPQINRGISKWFHLQLSKFSQFSRKCQCHTQGRVLSRLKAKVNTWTSTTSDNCRSTTLTANSNNRDKTQIIRWQPKTSTTSTSCQRILKHHLASNLPLELLMNKLWIMFTIGISICFSMIKMHQLRPYWRNQRFRNKSMMQTIEELASMKEISSKRSLTSCIKRKRPKISRTW